MTDASASKDHGNRMSSVRMLGLLLLVLCIQHGFARQSGGRPLNAVITDEPDLEPVVFDCGSENICPLRVQLALSLFAFCVAFAELDPGDLQHFAGYPGIVSPATDVVAVRNWFDARGLHLAR